MPHHRSINQIDGRTNFDNGKSRMNIFTNENVSIIQG
jgi:hypothetical protein